MTLEEAKEFYFQYYGFSFHMGREEPARYDGFHSLGLGKETLSAWDEELLDGLFDELRTRRPRLDPPWEYFEGHRKEVLRCWEESGQAARRDGTYDRLGSVSDDAGH